MLDSDAPIQLEPAFLDRRSRSSNAVPMPAGTGRDIAGAEVPDVDTPVLQVGLIDGHRLGRECLVETIGRSLAGLALAGFSSVQEAVLSAAQDPDLILYHNHAPGLASLADITTIRRMFPSALLIILSDAEDAEQPHVIRNALKHGARGFIPTRSMGVPMIVAAIRFVHAGGTYVPLDLLLSLCPQPAADRPAATPRNPLTSRELTVLGHVHQGKANKMIAYELGMKESTVKVHVRHIMRKTGTTNRVQAAYTAHNLWDVLPAQKTADAMS